MRGLGLFWRLVLSFWLTSVLTLIATIAVLTQLADTAEQRFIDNPAPHILRYYAEQGQRAADRGGEALRQWLKQLERQEPMPLYLLDFNGHDLLDRPAPKFIPNIGTLSDDWPQDYLIKASDGEHYLLVPDTLGIGLGRLLSASGVVSMRLLFMMAGSLIVCFFLARYLSAPVRELRHVTGQIAAADLSARVGTRLGQRRDEIGALGRDFNRMAERVEALLANQQRLLRDVSHELRSPLARLQVALGLARKRAAGHASTELDRIERETDRIDQLIGELLSLNQLKSIDLGHSGSAELIDLAELIANVTQDANYEAGDSGRRVCVTHTVSSPLRAAPELLYRAVENVVRNALRYTASGSLVELSLSHEPDPATVSPWAVLRVRDHGPGVPPQALSQLFEPFFRVAEARERGSGGHGLGLAIAEQAVRLHGGRISAANAPGGGLVINIRLPLTRGKTRNDHRSEHTLTAARI